MISPSLWEAAFEAWSEFSKRDQNATGVRLRVMAGPTREATYEQFQWQESTARTNC